MSAGLEAPTTTIACWRALVAIQQRDGLEKVGVGHLAEDPELRSCPVAPALFPVLAEVELVGGVGSGEQLKHRQGDPAGVDLLKDWHTAWRWRVTAKLNDWNLVLVEAPDELSIEGVPELDTVPVMILVPLEAAGQSSGSNMRASGRLGSRASRWTVEWWW
jgi:hypothetical protein